MGYLNRTRVEIVMVEKKSGFQGKHIWAIIAFIMSFLVTYQFLAQSYPFGINPRLDANGNKTADIIIINSSLGWLLFDFLIALSMYFITGNKRITGLLKAKKEIADLSDLEDNKGLWEYVESAPARIWYGLDVRGKVSDMRPTYFISFPEYGEKLIVAKTDDNIDEYYIIIDARKRMKERNIDFISQVKLKDLGWKNPREYLAWKHQKEHQLDMLLSFAEGGAEQTELLKSLGFLSKPEVR